MTTFTFAQKNGNITITTSAENVDDARILIEEFIQNETAYTLMLVAAQSEDGEDTTEEHF